jgi:hypothetical protein
MPFDAGHAQAVVFSGRTATGGFFGDTWTWSEGSAFTPPPRGEQRRSERRELPAGDIAVTVSSSNGTSAPKRYSSLLECLLARFFLVTPRSSSPEASL